MNKKIYLLGMVLMCLELAACGGSGPTNTTGYGPGVLFVETWEDYPVGSFPDGWRSTGTPYNEIVVEFPDNHKLMLDGPASEAYAAGGIHYNFKPGTMKPTYIHYNIHPYPVKLNPGVYYPPYDDIGQFVVNGYNNEIESGIIMDVTFRHDGNGEGFLITRGVCYPGCEQEDKIDIDNAFEIELRNIHWDTYPHITYDLWINGTEIETCIHASGWSDSISSIMILNRNRGRMHIDNIYMANLPYQNTCIALGEPAYPDTMPLPPADPPSEPVLFIFEMPAFCRGGPSSEYPKISTYPEGAELEISGHNIESSWWWSEAGGCWVSDYVGQLIRDTTTLEIIIPPPPPAPEDLSSEEDCDGQSDGCHAGLDQATCIEEGGTWDEPPTQAGTCVCP